MFFNPGNPRYRRGVFLFSVVASSLCGAHIVLADFGAQDHVFTPIQKYLIPKIDSFFGLTVEDILKPELDHEKVRPWVVLKKGGTIEEKPSTKP